MNQGRSGWRAWAAGLVAWIMLGGLAPSPQAPRLSYAALDLGSAGAQILTFASAALPPVTSRGTPRPLGDAARAQPRLWRLSVNAGMSADSNVTNASRDRFIPFLVDDAIVPVELDPSLRARSGSGRHLSVSSGIKLRLSDGTAFAVDAEGQATDHRGRRNDDISFLLAAGPELTWSGGSSASVQLVAAQSWYGGRSAQAGVGLRGQFQTPVGEGQRVSLSFDARRFNSDYGREFGGTQAGAYLGYSKVLDQVTTGSLGIYARRDWLRADAYSNLELGAYGGVTRYLSDNLTGSLTGGFSRTAYDAPLAYLSPQARKDWRFSAGAQLTTRRPIGLGVYPTLGYSYNRTDGSIEFFDTSRHRFRIGLQKDF